jgi:YidC/Oxa1 family membrane protein insertase
MDIFHNFFYVPIFNVLMFFYQIFGQNLGIAIVMIAFAAKLITLPLTRKQLKSAGKNREFQTRMAEVKKKYKNNEPELNQELARLQAEFLPGQLGGCLNLIIIIVLLIQVRNVVVNLVNQGVHAYNQVAYSESFKFPEDSIGFKLPSDFSFNTHTLTIEASATNGNKITEKFPFGLAESDQQKTDLTNQLNQATQNLTDEQKAQRDKDQLDQRTSGISIFVEQFSGATPVLIGHDQQISVFLRPPSQQKIVSGSVKVLLDDKELGSDKLAITSGTTLNFNFLGADLSKVASDIGFNNIGGVLPYVIIAVLVGITQFFASKIQTSMMAPAAPKKEKPKNGKKKDEKEDSPDFATMMQQSTKQMSLIFPAITVMMSLGFLGGATIFPTGVSLFWTGQNGFAIIEQLISNREKIIKQVRDKLYERRTDTKDSKGTDK